MLSVLPALAVAAATALQRPGASTSRAAYSSWNALGLVPEQAPGPLSGHAIRIAILAVVWDLAGLAVRCLHRPLPVREG